MLKKTGVNFGLNTFNQKNYIVKTIDEMLFTGYEDGMIDLAKKLPMFDASEIPFDKFGWFYTVNIFFY